MLYRLLARPILFRLPPESAHDLALRSLSLLQYPTLRRAVARRYVRTPFGNLKRFGLTFRNPVGLAAGFDKNGAAANLLDAFGFGFIEVGTVTGEAQPGNPKPRIFRLALDRALINRLGFNNCGAKALVQNLKRHRPDCVLGINIGKSRSVAVENAIPDYLKTFETIYDTADYVAVNVSSPNTPQLRELQQPEMLSDLLGALQTRNHELAEQPKPLLLKIAPDLTENEIASIVQIALEQKVSGIIATNTTINREGLQSSRSQIEACGEGGLSGAPLRERSNEVISLIYRLTNGSMPIIGVGGVFTAEDAWEKICAGASLVQLYTGFIYEGPGMVRDIHEGLRQLVSQKGFVSLDEAVGSSVKV